MLIYILVIVAIVTMVLRELTMQQNAGMWMNVPRITEDAVSYVPIHLVVFPVIAEMGTHLWALSEYQSHKRT